VEDLEVIRRSGRDLLGLINSILDLSKMEAGKMNLDLDNFQLSELMDEVGRFAIPLVREKGNRFHLIEGPSLEIRQDRTKIKQVLINLLGNASKFTENGEVSLGSRLEGEWLHLWVTDTGIGMNEEQCSRIFEEFRQADDSTTRKYGGTGLGLSIVQRFSELLKGRIELTSQPGQGSTFTLVIPANLG
jgi:signal transduction histidine kinase